MKTVRYGDWEIAVDIEKTKQYYASYSIQPTQANRNFAEYCKNLSDEEKAFFDSFGIDPLCCDVQGVAFTKKGEYPCYGFYFVCGEYVEHPPEMIMPVEELIANNFVDDRPDPRINIGVFQFNFQCEDFMLNFSPDDMPEGYICINFWCENMKWLLKERCEAIVYEPPKPWELHKKLIRKIKSKKQHKVLLKERKKEFEDTFKSLGIFAVPMTAKEHEKYNLSWLAAFAPADANMKKLKDICISDRYGSKFLWHIFSYEILECQQEQAAIDIYNQQQKQTCVILSNIDPIGYRLENAEKLNAEVLDKFIDVTVTANDFSWTYCKTHEYDCGPYFCKQNSNIANNVQK